MFSPELPARRKVVRSNPVAPTISCVSSPPESIEARRTAHSTSSRSCALWAHPCVFCRRAFSGRSHQRVPAVSRRFGGESRLVDEAKRVDDSRKRGWLLLPTGIVEEEAGEGRTPIFEHAHQRATGEVWRYTVFRHPGQAGPVDSSLDHKFQVVEEQRAADRDRHRLIALIEFPPVLALTSVTEADASMLQHVSWRCRLGV